MRLSAAEARERFAAARVARLATADAEGRPHLVPVVFAVDGDRVYTIGTAGEVGATARRVAPPLTAVSTATSSTVPQVPQSGQRPTHLAVAWWHSEQRYCERAFATP